MRPRLLGLIFGICIFVSAALPACIWDADTIWEESRRFPGTYEIVLGDFPRHSPEFHRWRIKDREGKSQGSPQPDHYDDIAVSHFRLGDIDAAIRTIVQKEEKFPGLYETEANWSVFLMADGRWEEGLKHVRRALEINPNAHFGREKYQAWLAEYILERKTAGEEFPFSRSKHTFADYLKKKIDGEWDYRQVEASMQAVAGMLRFANHESPILLEACASILESWKWPEQPKLLPATIYLAAARATEPDELKRYFRERAAMQVANHHPEHWAPKTLNQLEAEFDADRTAAEAKYLRWRSLEIDWIRNDRNPESEGRMEIARREAAEQRLIANEEAAIAAESARRKLAEEQVVSERTRLAKFCMFLAATLALFVTVVSVWATRVRMTRERERELVYRKR